MDTNSNQSNNTAILLISHGSTRKYNEEVFTEISQKFKKQTGFDTEVGYMKVSNPDIPNGIKNLKNRNKDLERIIAVPVFLADGIHTRIDIPTMLGLEPLETDPRCPNGEYPEGHYLHGLEEIDFNREIKLLPPIGPNEKLIKIIDNRINIALKDSKLENPKTAILLVSHGSRLNYNKEFITKLHQIFQDNTNYDSTYGFMELVQPTIPESINKLEKETNMERLIVVPVFISHGKHTKHDIPTILKLPTEHEETNTHNHSHDHTHDLTQTDFKGEILYTEPIGADDILIEILKENIEKEL